MLELGSLAYAEVSDYGLMGDRIMPRKNKALPDSHTKFLGETIAMLRGATTQDELAEELDCERKTIIAFENGKRMPQREMVQKLLSSVLANTDDKKERLVNALTRAYLGGEEVGTYRKEMLIGTQSSGVLRAFRDAEQDQFLPLLPHIKAAKHDLFFLGYNMLHLFNYTEQFKIKVDKGIPVRLLLPDTCKTEMMKTIACFWDEIPYLFQQFEFYYGEWAKVWKETSIQVRACSTYPPFTAEIFDRKRGDIQLYIREWSIRDRMLLELDLEHGAKDVMQSLDKLWNDSVSLSSQEEFDKRIVAARKLAAEISA